MGVGGGGGALESGGPPPGGGPCGCPAPPAGAPESGFRCTLPSGAFEMNVLSASEEPKDTVCGPTIVHVTVSPVLTPTLSGPNNTGTASCTSCDPPPTITPFGVAVGMKGGRVPPLMAAMVDFILSCLSASCVCPACFTSSAVCPFALAATTVI